MIFVLPLPAALANVRYRWLANGVLGVASAAGVTQVGTFNLFRIDTGAPAPAQAEELIVYDVSDDTNFALAHYAELAAGGSSSITPQDISDIADAVYAELVAQQLGAQMVAALWGTALPGDFAAHQAGAILARLDIVPPDAPVIGVPAPNAPNQSIGYLTTRDGQGSPEPGVRIFFRMIVGPTDVSDSYFDYVFSVVSDGDALLSAPFRKLAKYQAKRVEILGIDPAKDGKGWVTFTVAGDQDSFALPQILGHP